ncbi:hypothetical protein DUI87_21706 [Hirundo rustica rustica]|uniref:Uncharacterized protein n=1 Tax=Hirundo rustica rustica TaxID=333673 RepID=A0A3M0JKU1_HIRRU|nr:hypothetical protein DUI87_21706 [Hirundo rustica rustica]
MAALGNCPERHLAAAGCATKNLVGDELFQMGWTWGLHPCEKGQDRLCGRTVWTGKLGVPSYRAGPLGFDGKMSNVLRASVKNQLILIRDMNPGPVSMISGEQPVKRGVTEESLGRLLGNTHSKEQG